MVDARQAQALAAKLPAALTRLLRGVQNADADGGLGQKRNSSPRLAVAFSGGLDSRFLCHAARLCGADVLALHATGPHIPQEESRAAIQWAHDNGLPLALLHFNPLLLPEAAANSRERCYVCKQGLIAAMRAVLAARGETARLLCDGSNADDAKAFRPGLRALAEAGVRSPLAEAGLCKAQIRALAASTGLDNPRQRARPCLLTRLEYGLAPDSALLARLAAAEAALARLPSQDKEPALGDFRLRLTPAPVLQVTRLPASARHLLDAILTRYGFTPYTLRESGAVSGFFDAAPLQRAACPQAATCASLAEKA